MIVVFAQVGGHWRILAIDNLMKEDKYCLPIGIASAKQGADGEAKTIKDYTKTGLSCQAMDPVCFVIY